jgi:hypothetical protein
MANAISSKEGSIAKQHAPAVQTGPKTEAGKQASSKNAQKAAIFTKGYLPWEDVATKQAQLESLAEQWGAFDPTRQMILRTIEQAHLGLERMMAADKLRIEGMMQSQDIKREFGRQSGIDSLAAMNLPAWFFKEDDGGQKEYVQFIYAVLDNALALQEQFCDQIVPHIAQKFPALFEFIMDGQRPNTSFLIAVGQRYKQQTFSLNLIALINELKNDYRYHLLWAVDADSYQVIIGGIRASQMMEVMDLDRANRYATSFQNRMLKGYQALSSMDQIESAKEMARLTLENQASNKPSLAPKNQRADDDLDDAQLVEI